MAARGFEMDTWMNRYRAFAEGVVIMVCPVLLAIALNGVNLKREEHGCVTPITMLVVAAVTLIAGICPFLVCCFSKIFSSESSSSPHTVTKLLAPLSSTCLVILACWIIHLIIVDNWAYPAIGGVVGLCILVRTVSYFCANNTATEGGDCSSKLENSIDFSAGVAALLFIGLEGLALEGQVNRDKAIQHRLTKPMGASFIACAVGVCLMLVETVPPLTSHRIISKLTHISDFLMASAVFLVMFFIMHALMKLRALLLLATPFLILLMQALHVAVNRDARSSNNNDSNATLAVTTITIPNEGTELVAELNVSSSGNLVATPATNTTTGHDNSDEQFDVHNNVNRSNNAVPTTVSNTTTGPDGNNSHTEEYKVASLELTKVTFTGFLAVSIRSIGSNRSFNKSTECFIHLAAGAIVSGLIWRCLTHINSNTAKCANAASLFTHLCVAIATVPLTIMAGNALS